MSTSFHYLSQMSVLIVTYMGDDLLANCLASLQSSCSNHIEVVVVDNSANATTKAIVCKYANTKYIASKSNLGFAGGNNLGLPFCTRPFVLLLNNDTIIHNEPFSELIQYLEEHPNVAVVQGKMKLPKQGDVLDSCGSLITPEGEQAFLFDHAPIMSPTKSRPIFAAKGACLLFRKSIIPYVGGFLFYDHFKSYYEDVDFCHRVWLAGYEVHFVNTTPIDHLLGRTAAKFSKLEIAAQGLSNAEFSLFVNLSATKRHTLFFRRKLYYQIVSFVEKIHGNSEISTSFQLSRAISLKRRREEAQTQAKIQATRKVSDEYIFQKVGTVPPMKCYILSLQGKYGEILQHFWR